MIRVRHITLPSGLIAVVRKDSDGGLQVFVSDTLPADRQRAAVRLALRSIYRPGRRAGLLPVPVGLLLGICWRSIMPITRAVRSHVIASSAAAFLAAAGAAALIVGLPQHHGPTMAGQGPGRGQVHAPAVGRTHVAGEPRKPGLGRSPLPKPGATDVAGRSAATPSAPVTAPAAQSAAPSASQPAPAQPSTSPAPPPTATPSPTQTPAPSPSPSSSGDGNCLVILGVWVCL